MHPSEMTDLFPNLKMYDEDFETCCREDIQKLIALEVESFQEERKTLPNPYESVHPNPE